MEDRLLVVNTNNSEVLTVSVYMEDGRCISFTLLDPGKKEKTVRMATALVDRLYRAPSFTDVESNLPTNRKEVLYDSTGQ